METKYVSNTEINPIVSLSEWHNQYPLVDREYVWIYPLLRNESFTPQTIFAESSIPLLSLDTGLYVHVPACLFRCPMCPFYLEIIKGREDLKGYADAIISEMEMYATSNIASKLNLRTIYFGGGTATLLYPEDVGRIVQCAKSLFPSKSGVEATVEGHPRLVNYEYLSALHDQGVNRVSFGIQSFDEAALTVLGLCQTPRSNRETLRNALKIGFETVAMDLLYRLPNQSVKAVEVQLTEALDLGVTSLSAYSLELSVRQLELRQQQPDDETDREMFYMIHDKLTGIGWHHTAQPDYAASGHVHQELTISWHAPQGQNLSLGAGAWGAFNNVIYCNVHNIKEYISQVNQGYIPVLAGQEYTLDDAISRYPVLGVRCFDVPLQPFKEFFGIDLLEVFYAEIGKLQEQGLVTVSDEGLTVTRKGKYYIDNISKTFYSIGNRCRLQPWGARTQGAIAKTYLKVR